MSLDVSLTISRPTEIYWRNITHNLAPMAEEAGLYQALWRPEELGFTKAAELIEVLTSGLELLQADPVKFRVLNPRNGWGKYENLVDFVESYLSACKDNPEANIRVSR